MTRSDSLADEARKYPTAEDFCNAFSYDVMRGRYWHITDDPEFEIKDISPRDLSTASAGGGSHGLMVTSTPEVWRPTFSRREFMAEIDMSAAVPKNDYTIVNRGFGHEVFVHNLDTVSVKNVKPIAVGMRDAAAHHRRMRDRIPSKEACVRFWEAIRG